MSFEAAQKAGAHGVEFDVMFSADKKIIVFHDYKLQKRLTVEGKVSKMTLKELQKVDLTQYYTERNPGKEAPAIFKKAKVPTLEEVFAYYKKQPKAILNIEIKNKDPFDKGFEKALAEAIKKAGFEKRVLVSSFNPFAVRRFRLAAPGIPLGLIYSPKNPIYIRNLWFLRLAKPDALHPDHKIIDANYMKWARGLGLKVHTWTVNDPKEMKRLIDLGVEVIITDFPDRLTQVLAGKDPKDIKVDSPKETAPAKASEKAKSSDTPSSKAPEKSPTKK